VSPLAIWWRTHRLERTVLIGCLVLAVVVAFNIWRVNSLTGTNQRSGDSATRARPTPAPTTSAAPTPVPTPDPAVVAQAQQVAAAFLVAWATYRWDDTPQTQAQRLHPYTAIQFAQSARVSPVMAQQRQATHEAATARVANIQLYGQTATGQLGFNAQVTQDVRSDQGANSRTLDVQVTLQPSDQGWQVSGIDK
jgi:hypothetical protein